MISTIDTPVIPRRRDDVVALIALAICATVFLWPVVGGGQRLTGGDIINQYLPYRHVVNEAIGAGEWPWWNPWSFCGQPLAANLNAALFYPPNLLSIFIPLSLWFGLTLWGHVLWGLAGTYLFHRRIGLSPPSAMLGSLVFWGSGFFIFNVFSGIVLFHQAGAWWPWLMLATLAWTQSGNRRWIALGGASLALMFLCGSPQIFFYGAGVSLLTGAVLCLSNRRWVKRIAGVAVMLAIAALLIQVQFQPAREQSALSQRATYEGEAAWTLQTGDSLMWRSLALALVPQMNGDLTTKSSYYGSLQGFHEVVPAVMTPPLLLVLIGLVLWRRRREGELGESGDISHQMWLAFNFAMGALALWAAFGQHSPLFKLLWSAVPGFSEFRVPARLSLVTLWCLSSLAALMFEQFLAALRTGKHRRGWMIFGWSLFGIGLLVVAFFTLADTRRILYAFGMPEGVAELNPTTDSPVILLHAHLRQFPSIVELARRSLLTWGLAITLTGLGLAIWASWRRLWLIGVGTLAAACLLTLPPRLDLKAVDADEFDREIYRDSEVFDVIEANIGDGRILCHESVFHFYREHLTPGLTPNRALLWGVPQTRGYDPIIPLRLAQYSNAINGLHMEQSALGRLLFHDIREWELVRQMNVTLVASYDSLVVPDLTEIWSDHTGLKLYSLRDAVGAGRWMPSWNIASQYEVENFNVISGRYSLAFNAARSVILEEPLTQIPVSDASPDEATVTLVERGFDRVTFEVDAPAQGYLLTDVYHHPGWQSWVNDERALVSRGNLLWCAVPVGEGISTVELRFRPASLVRGSLLTLAGLLLLVASLVVGRDKRNPRSVTPRV